MHNIAPQLQDTVLHQTVGTVVSTDDGLVVATNTSRYAAERAVSCLVAPRIGDRVMVAVTDESPSDVQAWVLAVLQREHDGVTLAVDGDLDVQSSGRLRLSGVRGIELASRAVSFVASKLEVKALEGHVVIESLDVVGRRLRSEIERVKSVAGTVDTVMDRFSQKVARSYRTVTEMDQLRAERIDHVAEQTMNLRGKDTVMTAERLVKVDGEQIHMG